MENRAKADMGPSIDEWRQATAQTEGDGMEDPESQDVEWPSDIDLFTDDDEYEWE